MEKRYQVFVSSTFTDLEVERESVIRTLMEMDCIPAGMELFPAADEEQWAFIERVIDDCDYYVLLIGGRYGSVTEDGVSYTEKEYEYAKSIGLKVLAFIHGEPEQLPVARSDTSPSLKKKLDAFRQNAAKSRLVKFWSNPAELPGLIALSLTKAIKTYPAVGWVRASDVVDQSILLELNDLRKENERFSKRLKDPHRHEFSRADAELEMSAHETAALIAIADLQSETSGYVFSYVLKKRMEELYFTGVAVTLAVKGLSRNDLILESEQDDHNDRSIAYQLTDRGAYWLANNDEQVKLTIDPPPF